MKFTINVDCTPEEARQFVGLPDVTALQEKMMKELEEKMREGIHSMDPETFIKTWMPATMQGFGEMQKMFWSQMGVGQPGSATDPDTHTGKDSSQDLGKNKGK